MKQIGWISHNTFDEVEGVVRSILPPIKQYDGARRLVPKDQIRHCQHWAAEVSNTLQEKGVLTLLAPGDNGLVYTRDTNGEVIWNL